MEHLTLSQLADKVGVSRNWIYRRINQEGLHVLTPDGQYLIPDNKEIIEKWKALKAKDYGVRRKRKLVFPENRESKRTRVIAEASLSKPVHNPTIDTSKTREYLTISQLADKVGVGRNWILKRINQEGFRVPQASREYLIPDTEEIIEKWKALKAKDYDVRKKKRLVSPENRESKNIRVIAEASFSKPVHNPTIDTSETREYLTISQLADKVGVSTDWIRTRINQKGFRVPRTRDGRRYLIPDTEEIVEKWKALKATDYDFTKSRTSLSVQHEAMT